MSEPPSSDGQAGWLRDEPGTWHEVNRALQDISILLQYLGELPDARLLGYFKDTQAKLADAGARRSVPPCDDYALFLRRLFQIAAAFQTGRAALLPDNEAEQDGAGHCSAVAFVYWSRDFLSAVAAPATAESIRLTHDFLVNRAWWRKERQPDQAGEPRFPALPPDLGAPTRNRLAAKLAFRVRLYEAGTIAVVLLTLAVSVYALSGRLILSNEATMREAWSKLDAAIEAEEEKLFKPAAMPLDADARRHLDVTGLCDVTRSVVAEAGGAQLADNATVVSDAGPPSAPAGTPPTRTAYALPRQAHLCAERAKALLDLFVVTVHLQSWSSAITQSLGRAIAYPFGIVPATLHSFAEEDGGCFGLRPPELQVGSAAACERVLWDEIDRSRHVADAIQGAVTQYVLPVLYGFLGAMAAAMRLLRRKVDASLLSYTDRSRLQQGAILGVLCGAVIGLFATLVGTTGGPGNVGMAGLALLAGYNVDGVFRFLDELSDRLFRAGPPAKPG